MGLVLHPREVGLNGSELGEKGVLVNLLGVEIVEVRAVYHLSQKLDVFVSCECVKK